MDAKLLNPQNQRLLKPDEAAESLGISPRKLHSLNKTGRLTSVNIDRCLRYRPADLDRFVETLGSEGRV